MMDSHEKIQDAHGYSFDIVIHGSPRIIYAYQEGIGFLNLREMVNKR